MIKTLYIIGNGFDKSHNLNSSYKDFKEWLSYKRISLLEDIEAVWNCNSELWYDFEKVLGEIDFKYVQKTFGKYNETKIIQTYKELEKHSLQLSSHLSFHCLAEKLRPLAREIRLAFNDWILTLNQSLSDNHPMYTLDKDAFYITFNYTETLEKLYNIPSSSILHIHGKANSDDVLLFGHNKSAGQIEYEIEKQILGCNHTDIDDFSLCIGTLNKNVDFNAYKVSHYFEKLIDVNRIFILGYSFSDIDSLYIDNIFKKTLKNQPFWCISYYSKLDKERIFSTLINRHNIGIEKYILFKLPELDTIIL